jgi:N-acetylmuramoyl-L-alanine amidase
MELSVKDFTLPIKGIKPLRIFRYTLIAALLLGLSLLGSLLTPVCHCLAATIVLDPGHGGNDVGAGKGGDYTEKQFTLALAQKIDGLLSGRYRVELTRSADVEMAPADRAAVANHLRADLMISLHAAVAPYCSDRSAAIYYYTDEHLVIPSEMAARGQLAESDNDLSPWEMLQARHKHQSRKLATDIKEALEKSGTFDHVTVSGAPLVSLMGADLPAVLVEVGCIHPAATSTTQSLDQHLDAYAQAIADAIETAIPLMTPPQ